MKEYIVPVNNTDRNDDEMFVGFIRKREELTRCCDCVHFEYFEDHFVQMTHCDVHDKCPDYTDFCSWAERKEK